MAPVDELIERHQDTLSRALTALAERDYWSPYPEILKAYGETGAADGKAAFEALLGAPSRCPATRSPVRRPAPRSRRTASS